MLEPNIYARLETGMGYRIEQVEQLKKVLAALPKVRADPARLKTIDALRLLKNDIDNLQQKGYAVDAIAAILGQHGLRMSGKTLRNYLARIRLDPPPAVDKIPAPRAPTESPRQPNVTPSPPPLSVQTDARTKSAQVVADDTRGTRGFAVHSDTEDL